MERYEKSPFFRMVLLRGEEREEGRGERERREDRGRERMREWVSV